VEFDDVNQKVLTFCARGRHYQMWSMVEQSKLLYAITYPSIEEIQNFARHHADRVQKAAKLRARNHSPVANASWGRLPCTTRRLYQRPTRVSRTSRWGHQLSDVHLRGRWGR
jgi:hypothetical protein